MKLETLCEQDNVRIETTMTDKSAPWDRGDWSGYAYRVTLKRKGRQITVDFFCGDLCGEPTAADVLSCLISDAWAYQEGPEALDDMGYSFSNGREVWKAIEKQAPRTLRFLGDDFERYARAEH